MRAAPSTSARARETNVTLAVPRPFVLGKHPILSSRSSCPPSPNTRQRWTVRTCPTTVRIFITGSGFKSRATRFIWSSPGRSRNFRQRVEPEFVQLGPLPRASMSSRSPPRCHDPTSQSIAGSRANRNRSVSSRPPSTRALSAWTPHSLCGSIHDRCRYDINVYAGELEVRPPGAPTTWPDTEERGANILSPRAGLSPGRAVRRGTPVRGWPTAQ